MKRDQNRALPPVGEPWPRSSHDMACCGKTQYPNYTRANRAASAVARNRDGRVVPYRCKACRRWHVGNLTLTRGS